MHLTYDIFILKEVYSEFSKLRDSFRDEAEIAKARIKASDDLRKASEAREAKLEELRAFKGAIWELEVE